jgi:hypothetical protein
VHAVSGDDLRADALWAFDEWEAWLPTLESWSARFQPDSVIAYCRMLHTVQTGRLGSKPESAEWALRGVDPEWRPLILEARAERPDPWAKVKRAAVPERVERTQAFMAYVSRLARASAETPSAAR